MCFGFSIGYGQILQVCNIYDMAYNIVLPLQQGGNGGINPFTINFKCLVGVHKINMICFNFVK